MSDGQLSLLQQQRVVLARDEEEGIVYTPDFAPADLAQRWFEAIRDAVSWHSDRRMMYDREVAVPRLLGHFRLEPPAPGTPGVIHEIAQRVAAQTGVAFNAVGLNFYRDERDSVAPHNDHLYELVRGNPIALVSLGATRRMVIRSKQRPPHRDVQVPRAHDAQERPPPRHVQVTHAQKPTQRAINLDLAPGSLLIMSYASQLAYTHAIPKQRVACGPRISLAFRVKPADRLDRY